MDKEKKEILIINPDFKNRDIVGYRPRQPLSLAYVYSILKKDFKFHVDLLDFNIDTIKNIPQNMNYDYLIITSSSIDRWETPYINYKPCLETIQALKFMFKNMKVILTGPHGTSTPGLLFEQSIHIDIIVRGEPEDAIRDIFNGERLESIQGISFKRDGKVFNNKDRADFVDLDKLPFPGYEVLKMDKYEYNDFSILPKPFTIMETSRGCPHGCVFCYKVMHGNKYRYRSAKNIVDEIDMLQKKFNIKAVYFQELEFAVIKQKVMDFCNELIKRRVKINWACAARCSDIDEEMLELMKESGCKRISFGVESLSETILKNIKKGESLASIIKSRRLCNKYKIDFNSFTIIGFPGETSKTVSESIWNSLRFNVPYRYGNSELRAYPYTKLWEAGVKEKTINLTSNPWEETRRTIGKISNDGSYTKKTFLIKMLLILQQIRNGIRRRRTPKK